MRILAPTLDARKARNAGLLARADQGAGNSAVLLYGASGTTLLAVRQLAKPCGAVRPGDGRIVLAQAPTNDDVVLATGAAAWGEWRAADGTVLGQGAVTDENGFQTVADQLVDTGDIGPWVLEGANGTLLYEGGIVLLTEGVIG
jgi:hypothetical protein